MKKNSLLLLVFSLTAGSVFANPKDTSSVQGGLGVGEWYTTGLIVLAVLAALGGAIWYFYLRKPKYPVKRIFNHKNFTEFCKSNDISVGKIYKLNPHTIPEDYTGLPEHEKDKLKKRLKGEFLIVGYSRKKQEDDEDTTPLKTKSTADEDVPASTGSSNYYNTPPKTEGNREVLEKLGQVEMALARKIDQVFSARSAAHTTELNDLNNRLASLEKEYEAAAQKNGDLNTAKRELEKALEEKERETTGLGQELRQLQLILIPVPFLKDYCKTVSSLFGLISEVHTAALAANQETSSSKSDINYLTGAFLLKYGSKTTDELPGWKQSVQYIIETGHTADKTIIKNLSQLETDADKVNQFKKLILKEIIEKEISYILILADALSHITRFAGVGGTQAQQIETDFKNFSRKLLDKSNEVNLKVRYVPLFTDYTAHAAYTRAITQPLSLPYSEITNLERDFVAEIISYGVETPFESSETLMILA
jgi:hypothetical protein